MWRAAVSDGAGAGAGSGNGAREDYDVSGSTPLDELFPGEAPSDE